MRPWLVFASQLVGMPLMRVCGVVHVFPAFVDETNPTLSWVLPDG
jgi:hypothetical protein